VPNAPEPIMRPRMMSDSFIRVNKDISGAAFDGLIGYTHRHTHAHKACSTAVSEFQPNTLIINTSIGVPIMYNWSLKKS